MHRIFIPLIIALTVFTYANSVPNGFVGDDAVIIVNNDFYKNPGNLKRLFHPSYLTESDQLFLKSNSDFHSGSVAYRPILSLTYFLDYSLWKLNPFGYHLQNLILHVMNSLLVYFFIFLVLNNEGIASFGSLLFGTHPINTEAVCNIGYRADILALFFFLISLLCYGRSDSGKEKRGLCWYGGSLVSFLLAVFTKESALILPFVVIAYDYYIRRKTYKELIKMRSRYLGFIMISVLYLIIYLAVFTNTALRSNGLIGHFLPEAMLMARILVQYLVALLIPFTVGILPPLYTPPNHFWGDYSNILTMMGMIVFFWGGARMIKQKTILSFFAVWFLLGFLPVSNIIPLPNPMAFRFMYLPSVGFLAAAAILICDAHMPSVILKILPNAKNVLKILILGSCIFTTVSLNGFWKSNFAVASQIVMNYPDNSVGHIILGIEYFKAGLYRESEEHLQESVRLGTGDPRVFYMLGVSAYQDSPSQAEGYFNQAIRMRPDYTAPYFSLGKMYFNNSDYERALPYLEKSLMLDEKSFPYYRYLLETYLKLNRHADAEMVFNRARLNFKDPRLLELLGFILADNPQ